MSTQIPLFETKSDVSTTDDALEEVVKEVCNTKLFLDSLPITTEVTGTSFLRLSIKDLALSGCLSSTKSGWRELSLRSVVRTRSGNSKLIKGKLHGSPGFARYPGFSASGQDVWLDTFEHEGDAIILSAVGARCGKAFRAKNRWSAIANTHIVWPDLEQVTADYAHLRLNDERFWVRSGGAQPFVKVTKSLEKIVTIPPVSEQIRLVAKVAQLTSLSDLLAAKQAEKSDIGSRLTKASLEALTTAETPEEFALAWKRVSDNFETIIDRSEKVEELRRAIANAAFSRTLGRGDSSAWPIVPLSELATLAGGVAKGRKLDARPKVSLPYLRVANVQRGYLNLSIMKEIEVGAHEIARYSLQENDVLFVEGGDWDKVGRSVVWRGEIEQCLHQNHIFRARLSDKVSPEWLSTFANSGPGRRYFEAAAKQTTNLASINMSQLKALPVPVPPLQLQETILKRMNKLLRLCDLIEAKLRVAEKVAAKFAEAVVRGVTA